MEKSATRNGGKRKNSFIKCHSLKAMDRNFLMFLPIDTPDLDAVMSYYDTYIVIGSEGDVSVHGSPGLGINVLLYTLFGSLFDLAQCRPGLVGAQTHSMPKSSPCRLDDLSSKPNDLPWDPGEHFDTAELDMIQFSELDKPIHRIDLQRDASVLDLLTDLLPDAGYFLAGGIAGFTSRTATAPLDRLKVYLIAQTGVKKETTDAVKSGSPVKAVKAATRPLFNACIELWRMGGIRSLFAGKSSESIITFTKLMHLGNGLNVLKVMPESAIKFGSYEASKRIAARMEGHENSRSLSGLSQFVAAGMGGVISQYLFSKPPSLLGQQANRFRFAVYPLDTLKL